MPIKKAAFKSLRADAKRRARNLGVKTHLKNLERKLTKAVAQKNAAETQSILAAYVKALDKAAQNSVLKKNTAARLKSRASKRVQRELKAKAETT